MFVLCERRHTAGGGACDRRGWACGPGTRVRGRRAGRGPGARGAGRGPGAQRKPSAESPREVTRKRREGAARGREEAEGVAEAGAAGEQGTQAGLADGTTRPSAASRPHRPAGRNTARACVGHTCARVCPRGGAGQGRARGTTARECTRARKSRPRTENSARTAPQNNADVLRTFPHATLYRVTKHLAPRHAHAQRGHTEQPAPRARSGHALRARGFTSVF